MGRRNIASYPRVFYNTENRIESPEFDPSGLRVWVLYGPNDTESWYTEANVMTGEVTNMRVSRVCAAGAVRLQTDLNRGYSEIFGTRRYEYEITDKTVKQRIIDHVNGTKTQT